MEVLITVHKTLPQKTYSERILQISSH